MAICYAKLIVSSLAVVVTSASIHFAHTGKDNHWPDQIPSALDALPANDHPSKN